MLILLRKYRINILYPNITQNSFLIHTGKGQWLRIWGLSEGYNNVQILTNNNQSSTQYSTPPPLRRGLELAAVVHKQCLVWLSIVYWETLR